LPRLTFAPGFEDEIEVRLQFALKWFTGHIPIGRMSTEFPQINGYLQLSTLRAHVN
jgi:hypothetical protein